MGGETVAVEVNDVDIDGAQSKTLFQNAGAFVDERVDTTIDDLFLGDFSLWNASRCSPFANELRNFRIGNGAAVLVVFIPACASFLAVAAHLAEVVAGKCLANSLLLQVAIFLANAPANVKTGQIADGERPHRHAEIVHSGIDRFDTGSFFQKKNGLADVRMKHPVANEAAAISHQNTDLADFF